MKKLTAVIGLVCGLGLAGCETSTTTTTTTRETATTPPKASMDPSVDNTRSTTMDARGPR